MRTARGGWPDTVEGTLALLLLVVLVPVLLVQASIYVSRYRMRREGELQANLELARAVAGSFDAYLDDVLGQEGVIALALAPPERLPAARARRILSTVPRRSTAQWR